MADILKTENQYHMIYTIGAGVGADFSLEDANYDKIIKNHDRCRHRRIAWWNTSLNLLFYRYMRPLVEAGHVYIALPPTLQDV